MNSTSKVPLGIELKLNISIDPIDGIHMSEYDFEVSFFTRPSMVKVFRSRDTNTTLKKIDDDNYLVILDTKDVGPGQLKVSITAYIPDTDEINDYVRTEIIRLDPKITIIR